MEETKPSPPSKKKSKKADRSKYFASIVYPESAPSNWFDLLRDRHIPALVSPIHDRDINADKSPKKPHFHVMLLFDGLKSPAQARAVFETIGGVGCEMVESCRGMARYLCHLDNPEKAQYETSAVQVIGDVDYFQIISSASSKYLLAREIIFWICENQITSYRELMLYSATDRQDWFKVLMDHSSISLNVIQTMKSIAWEENK